MIYIVAIILHFTFDWILQPRDIAVNKSKSFSSLSQHLAHQVNTYLCLVALFVVIYKQITFDSSLFIWLVYFAWGQTIIHGLIDWYLPRLFKPEKSERRMINMVAVDQMLHLVILFWFIEYTT